MGNEVSSEFTKEDLIELKKKQLQLEKENRRIREELEKTKSKSREKEKDDDKKEKKDKHAKPIFVKPAHKKISVDYKEKNVSIDPFEIFDLEPDCSIDDIKTRYKKLIVRYHPDKSGYDSTQEFRVLQKAYALLLSIKEEEAKLTGQMTQTKESKEAERFEMENEFEQQVNYQFEPSSGNNFNRTKFNQMFEQNRFVDESERGYSDWMKDDTNFGQQQPRVASKERFNEAFEEHIQKQTSNQIIEYRDPETLICTTTGYEELGNDNSDFTNHGKYTDLKKAYTQGTLHPGQIRSRENYGNIEQLKAARSAPLKLSQEEEMYVAQKAKLEEQMEIARQNKMRDKDQAIEKHYSRLHGKAIELPSYRR
jgi:curved DNA-binding protein CbpA